MKKLNCRWIQEKENTKLMFSENAVIGEAEYHDRSWMLSTGAGGRPAPQHEGMGGPWALQDTGRVPTAVG